jgi:predicted transcriptional regulator
VPSESEKVTAADVFQALSDKVSLELFDFIATKNTVKSQTLRSMNGLSKKQYYSRVQQLIKFGVIRRREMFSN